ncbi:MAG TPA: type 1 glutamine amidotransferase [Chlorobaculum sp.]|uniref:Glutamine amidotransferase, class I n=1 Tax=Chlorobaculum tepidum (strain ATCC 49652 / DSM 12025 / NBRC 103806 / TLS) TaxID=194439 RepID=Q8KF20_CHLTE|nr:type 1 glutamine amidotransferase [Chlorobaculum tepidum]AAM71754.1 glutamine amidotransferase, class I [Chlorobaculum tepidum TLS]HBU23485.1 type 1 glutamine amidotransferase [Chlorobaculum sp.]
MSGTILVVQNISHEGPGLLANLLEEHAINVELCDLSKSEPIPDPSGYAAMVVLGGPQSANDATPQITGELKAIDKALDAGVPYLGICLGLQLLVKARGGSVVKCHQKEIGFREPDGEPFMVELTGDGKQDALFLGMPERLRVFQLHGETVEPAKGMTLLATGRGCKHQVVRVGSNAWGLQCHFEMTPAMFESWIGIDADLKAMNRDELLAEFEAISEEYTETGRSILLNFLAVTGLVKP